MGGASNVASVALPSDVRLDAAAPVPVRLFLSLLALLVLLPVAPARAGSANVAALQVALGAKGLYGGTVDGVSGSATRTAIRRFQGQARLPIVGVAGPATRRALGRRGRPRLGSRLMALGASGWDVAALQFMLGRHGFPSGTVDGGFGLRTRAAVLRFQRFTGLLLTGVAGPQTLARLRRPVRRPRLHLRLPSPARVSSRFGPRGVRFHAGVDFAGPLGAPVRAGAGGRVSWAGPRAGGYGLMVTVHHGGGVRTLYPHLSRILVRRSELVRAGTVVGAVGSTGRSSGPHLHWELRVRGSARDPLLAVRHG